MLLFLHKLGMDFIDFLGDAEIHILGCTPFRYARHIMDVKISRSY